MVITLGKKMQKFGRFRENYNFPCLPLAIKLQRRSAFSNPEE